MTLSRLQDLVVVGVDGTPASARALQWAASEAALRRSGLIITHLEPLDGEEGRFAHLTRRERLLARSARAVALSPLAVPLSTHLVRGGLRDIGDELIRLSPAQAPFPTAAGGSEVARPDAQACRTEVIPVDRDRQIGTPSRCPRPASSIS
ncbi:MAG TPA: universal stress protein [Microlunatus sp.]|nr:universal stress protein [Microlunatus sp.]